MVQEFAIPTRAQDEVIAQFGDSGQQWIAISHQPARIVTAGYIDVMLTICWTLNDGSELTPREESVELLDTLLDLANLWLSRTSE